MSIGLGPHLRMVALGVLAHWCPACDRAHLLEMGHRDSRKIDWDHDTKRPTFTPDIRHQVGDVTCHYRITDGRVEFLPDSTHILAGRTVDLPVYPPFRP